MPDALAYSEAKNSLPGYCSVNSRNNFYARGVLFFTACGKGKHNFGERLQVEAVLCSLGELLHTEFLVPVNSTKPECEAGSGAQRSDNVVSHAERDISVCGLRILRQQPLGILICFFRSPQGREVPFLQNRLLVRFHSSSKRQRKKSFTVFWVSFLTLPRQLAGLSQGFAEAGHALWIRLAINPAKEFFFVQEEITGQYPLAA